jgi:ABC-2 type transport system permease protein
MASAARLSNAVATAKIVASTVGSISFEQALADSLAAWQTPPIQVKVTSQVVEKKSGAVMSMSHSSPAMMLQFAMAGLLTSAQVMVAERKSRSLQRMLTTATSRLQILLGHFLATYILILAEFVLLIIFGQLILKVDYLRVPAGTLVVALASVLCISALGTLIGVLAKSDEQAVIFALLPMFILSALGGAWTPLELTSPGFQAVGHFSPVAWAMDGFKNIAARGLGFQSVLLPAAALVGYALLFFALAAWRFYSMQEK